MKELQLQEMASMEAQLQEAQHACLASRDAEQDRERKDKLLLEMLMADKERQLRNCVLQPKQPCMPPPFHLLQRKSSRCIHVNTDEEEEAALCSKPPSPWPRFTRQRGQLFPQRSDGNSRTMSCRKHSAWRAESGGVRWKQMELHLKPGTSVVIKPADAHGHKERPARCGRQR